MLSNPSCSPRAKMLPPAAKQKLIDLLGPRGYLDRVEDLNLYEYDASIEKGRPEMVVFPRNTEDVVAIVKIAGEFGVAIVGRGAGTGLSGGAIPLRGGVVVAFARMNRILEIDIENERALVEPGVVNLDITLAVQSQGYFYAPDPSSQRACTIGGNVAENAGGPHTLLHGVTTNHVLGIELVLIGGQTIRLGGEVLDPPGFDLLGVVTGSEGTFGVVTEITVRLVPLSESVRTLLAIFSTVEQASNAVSAIIGAGIVPAAMEMMDNLPIQAVEDAYHAGYPRDAGAVLLIEVEGVEADLDEPASAIILLCTHAGASDVRLARDAR